MPLKIALVCEAEADYRLATALAERVLAQAGEWVADVLEHCPLWWGLDQQGTFLSWRDVPELARQRGFRVHGHFGGEPAAPDARVARRALWLLRARHPDLDGVLLIRDDDRQTGRRQGLEQARDDSAWRDRIVIGLAHCKRECWVLSGFDPIDAAEDALLQQEKTRLGYDPCCSAEHLTAKHDQDKHSAKRVLALLTGGDPDREARCWETASLETLHERGQQTGLAQYLSEVKSVVVPRLLGHQS
jgi:hypothetical protein